MKKKLVNWLNGVVDRAIQSEAWQRWEEAEERAEHWRDRAEAFYAHIERLRQALHDEGKRAEHYKAKAEELEARIANALA
jgi:hypothetical protein